eukprot:scaffold115405_cov70-Phaeocystis_antarctica.AAC.2
MYNTEGASSPAPIGIVERVTLRLDYVRGAVASALWSLRLYAPARGSLLGLKKTKFVYCTPGAGMCTNLVLGMVQLYRVFILVSDYVRMEVTLVGASWEVVAASVVDFLPESSSCIRTSKSRWTAGKIEACRCTGRRRPAAGVARRVQRRQWSRRERAADAAT